MQFPLLIGALSLLLTASQPAGAQSEPELTLTIVPERYPSSFSKDAAVIPFGSKHFHVLLTNNSSQPINLYEEWNSWGYYGLSFEVTYPGSQIIKLMKTPRGWDKNFPSTVTIAPHGFYVFDVDFNNNRWLNAELIARSSSTDATCRMRAIYSIEKGKRRGLESQEKAWTGTISSEEQAYAIWY